MAMKSSARRGHDVPNCDPCRAVARRALLVARRQGPDSECVQSPSGHGDTGHLAGERDPERLDLDPVRAHDAPLDLDGREDREHRARPARRRAALDRSVVGVRHNHVPPPRRIDVGRPGLALALADRAGREPEPVGGAEREVRDARAGPRRRACRATRTASTPSASANSTSKENLEDAPRLRFLRLASVSPSVPITEIPNPCSGSSEMVE